jgi:hypothetical protein
MMVMDNRADHIITIGTSQKQYCTIDIIRDAFKVKSSLYNISKERSVNEDFYIYEFPMSRFLSKLKLEDGKEFKEFMKKCFDVLHVVISYYSKNINEITEDNKDGLVYAMALIDHSTLPYENIDYICNRYIDYVALHLIGALSNIKIIEELTLMIAKEANDNEKYDITHLKDMSYEKFKKVIYYLSSQVSTTIQIDTLLNPLYKERGKDIMKEICDM